MRSVFLFFALLSVPVTIGGIALVAHAADATLFYAPGAAPEPPVMVEKFRAPPEAEPTDDHVCFNDAETRERIVTHKLAEPFEALETGRQEGDALRAKLCRWKPNEFVYDIAVLRDDGRIVHVYMNAQNGRRVEP